MEQLFYTGNRRDLYRAIPEGSLIVLFAGRAPRKTADEMYPFHADRSFVYFTGIHQEESVFLAAVSGEGIQETLFLLPHDEHAERWTGRRLSNAEAEAFSGIGDCRETAGFAAAFRKLVLSGDYENLYLDIDQLTAEEPPRDALKLSALAREQFPFLMVKNLHPEICRLRTIKKPCEIEAMKIAQTITRDGIQAMMKASKPGMYEYQYKAEFDYALAQRGALVPAFPSIISVGQNNFCIHYHEYGGQAKDGEMVLNDVGAAWDDECTDVSRGWPVNGRFDDRQRALYECAYQTSNHMFEILKPGIPMKDVDRMAHDYCYELLHDLGLVARREELGRLMWHGGAHHVGLDVHDVVRYDGLLEPGYVFCVDIGIYCEDWGIGFRLEDNCHITEDGCENLSAVTPRSIEDIEAFMGKR